MGKWISNIIFSILVSWLVYCFFDFTLRETLVNQRDNIVKINLSSEVESKLQLKFNLTPGTIGKGLITLKLKPGNNTFNLKLYKELHVETMYLIADTTNSVLLNSIELFSPAKKYFFSLKSIEENTMLFSLSLNKAKDLEIEQKGLRVNYDNDFTVLAFKKPFFRILYKELFSRIFLISLLASITFFLALLYYLGFYKKASIQTSLAVNFCTLFLCLLFTPLLSQKENRTAENRALAPFPDLNVNIWRIPPKYTNYYNDRFPFRNSLIESYNFIMIKIFKTSPVSNFVQIGKEGWLFFSKMEVQKVYRGHYKFTDEELLKIKNKLEFKANELGKMGIPFYLMIPPLKHTIYPEYLPERIRKFEGQTTKREQLISYLKDNSKINVIDPYPVIIEVKDSIEAYYKTDSHWNEFTSFRVYQQTINRIAETIPEVGNPMKLNEFEIEVEENSTGDLVDAIKLGDLFTRKQYYFIPKQKRKSRMRKEGATLVNNNDFIHYDSELLKDKPRLLMYRDSFCEDIHPFLSEHFSYSIFIWSRDYDIERIKNEKPDVVVYEILERFIDELLK